MKNRTFSIVLAVSLVLLILLYKSHQTGLYFQDMPYYSIRSICCLSSVLHLPSVATFAFMRYALSSKESNQVAAEFATGMHVGLPEVVSALGVCWVISPFFVFLFFYKRRALYGKFQAKRSAFNFNGKLSWVLLESLPLISFVGTVFFICDPGTLTAKQWVLFAAFSWHYFYRTFIYTYRLPSMSPMNIQMITLMFLFNPLNGFLNGFAIVGRARHYQANFYVGLILFAVGWYINFDSDNRLMTLRLGRPKSPGTRGKYFIPIGGVFEWVSCANYFGEAVEWFGWALATWSLAGLGFAMNTVANLLPRALITHRFYRQEFGDRYPPSRKAMIPLVL